MGCGCDGQCAPAEPRPEPPSGHVLVAAHTSALIFVGACTAWGFVLGDPLVGLAVGLTVKCAKWRAG